MAQGTVLAEIVLEGDRSFRRAVSRSGESMDDAGRDAGFLSGTLGRTADSLGDVRNSALGAAGAFQLLQGRADEAGDEVESVGRSGMFATGGMFSSASAAAGTTSAFSALTVSTEGLALSFGSLTTSLAGVAALLTVVGGAAAALATTLVPLAATLTGLAAAGGALAGAFGAVIGSGALAYGKQLNEQYQDQLLQVRDQIEALKEFRKMQGELTDSQRERLRQLKQEEKRLDNVEGPLSALQARLSELGSTLADIIAEWGAGFAPLIETAITAFPHLVRKTLNAVGGLDRFAGVLSDLGSVALTVIPQIAGRLADLARTALPILVDGLRWLQKNGGSIFNSIMKTTRQVAPLLKGVGGAVVDALPSINKFGTTLLQQLLPAVEDGIRGFGNLLDRIMAFTKTKQFREIMDAIRSQLKRIGPELSELQKNFGKLFDALKKNGPSIIRGIGAAIDGVLDIVNAVTPLIVGFIDLVGWAAQLWSDFTKSSEQQEQNLERQGTLNYVASGATENAFQASPIQRQAIETVVRVTSDDEKFDAYLEEQIDDKGQSVFDMLNRGVTNRSGGD